MQPLAKDKTLSYTFMLPLLYGQNKAELSKHLKHIDNVYIDKDGITIHCVDMSNKAIYSPKIEVNYIDQYNLFIEGKYSKFNVIFKLNIIKFWSGNKDLMNIIFRNTNYISSNYIWSEYKEFLHKPIKKLELFNN